MARSLTTALLTLLFLAGPQLALPAPAASRDQARQALGDADAAARREAARRLGRIGNMADAALLVQALRDEDADTRLYAEQAIWHIWERSGDERIDRLYRSGVKQMQQGALEQAIATFTRIVRAKPDFAEGWNKRATLYFLAGEYDKALADCDETIKRNPAHFGALAGYGQIYLQRADYERALDYFRQALAVNPNMDAVRLNMLLLDKLIEERRRNSV